MELYDRIFSAPADRQIILVAQHHHSSVILLYLSAVYQIRLMDSDKRSAVAFQLLFNLI